MAVVNQWAISDGVREREGVGREMVSEREGNRGGEMVRVKEGEIEMEGKRAGEMVGLEERERDGDW